MGVYLKRDNIKLENRPYTEVSTNEIGQYANKFSLRIRTNLTANTSQSCDQSSQILKVKCVVLTEIASPQ